jgi:hypothetical protein
MKTIKHLLKVARMRLVSFRCKHASVYVSSCPYTGLTYTICDKCLNKVKVEKTVE